MADLYDPIPDLAALIRDVAYEDRSATRRAEVLLPRLGVGGNDPVSVEAIEAGLRKALDRPAEPSDRHPLVVWINAVNGAMKPECFPDVVSAYEAASTEYPFNNTRVTLGWCTQKHEAATAAGGEGDDG